MVGIVQSRQPDDLTAGMWLRPAASTDASRRALLAADQPEPLLRQTPQRLEKGRRSMTDVQARVQGLLD
jgi:hypothetical protein